MLEILPATGLLEGLNYLLHILGPVLAADKQCIRSIDNNQVFYSDQSRHLSVSVDQGIGGVDDPNFSP